MDKELFVGEVGTGVGVGVSAVDDDDGVETTEDEVEALDRRTGCERCCQEYLYSSPSLC